MAKKTFFDEHPLLKALAQMLLVSAGILIVVFVVIRFYSRHGKEYELPDLVGLQLYEIEKDNPLKLNYVIIDSIFTSGEASGMVLSQEPVGGTMVKKGRKVYLTITASNPNDVEMPQLADMSVRNAIAQLNHAQLRCGKLIYVESEYPNMVIEQRYKGRTIREGDPVEQGSAIDLIVGLGPNNPTSIAPFLIGRTADKAHNELWNNSLNVGKEHFGGVKNKNTAVVIQQEPDYTGVNRLPYGTEVELWYKDVEGLDVNQLRRDFRVDSSKIVYPSEPESEEDYIEGSYSGIEW